MLSLVNDAETELLKFFCTYPTTEFSISEIARETGLSKPWVSEKIEKFEEEDVVETRKQGNQRLARFNRDSNRALRLKQVLNLEQLYQSPLTDEIVEKYSYPEAVIVFGSFAKGEDIEDSDIDIAVITPETAEIGGKVMEREVSVTEFKPGEVPDNMLETLANGITVYGYLELE